MSKLNEINKRIAEMHLKPCAHCGGRAQLDYTTRISNCWDVWCVECGITFDRLESSEVAAEKWNRRADTSKDKLVAALVNTLETHHNLELANNPSYPATSVYIATKVALEAALKE